MRMSIFVSSEACPKVRPARNRIGRTRTEACPMGRTSQAQAYPLRRASQPTTCSKGQTNQALAYPRAGRLGSSFSDGGSAWAFAARLMPHFPRFLHVSGAPCVLLLWSRCKRVGETPVQQCVTMRALGGPASPCCSECRNRGKCSAGTQNWRPTRVLGNPAAARIALPSCIPAQAQVARYRCVGSGGATLPNRPLPSFSGRFLAIRHLRSKGPSPRNGPSRQSHVSFRFSFAVAEVALVIPGRLLPFRLRRDHSQPPA